jgi:hypothetical protein
MSALERVLTRELSRPYPAQVVHLGEDDAAV